MRKVHYTHGCDKGSSRWKYGSDYNLGPTTEVIEEATCKDCIRFVKKHKLRNRTEFPDIPTFDVVRSCRADNSVAYLTFTCPVCGKITKHGGFYDAHGKGDGHRVSHCKCWENGYFIREVAEKLGGDQ